MLRSMISDLAFAVALFSVGGVSAAPPETAPALPPQYRLQPAVMGEVRWTGGFWASRFEQAHSVTIPHMWKYFLGESDNIGMAGIGSSYAWDNFRIAAGDLKGGFVGARWIDGDFYKWLEAVAEVYVVTHDEELDLLMDKVIAQLGRAQQLDGYLNTQITVPKKTPFTTPNDHETYNLGHLMITAAVHYRATGKTNLLVIGKRAGDRLVAEFLGQPKHFIGYTSIMGLVELYRVTREPRYLELAERFLDMQGEQPSGPITMQDHRPFREEEEAVGHAVFGTYLYAGVADIYMETGEPRLFEVLQKLWHDINARKSFVTGANSGTHHHLADNGEKNGEGFGPPYELPNARCSNENCGSIGLVLLDWRLLMLTGDASYADSAERILYNTFLAGMGVEGKTFFYTNPLRRFGADAVFAEDDTMNRWMHRAGWCCPPNILRIIAQLQEQAYYTSPEGMWVSLYGGNELKTTLASGAKLHLRQESNYPWDGRVRLTLGLEGKAEEFSMMLRIPGWAKGATVRVNGRAVGEKVVPGTFLKLRRAWRHGDQVELNLPMETVLVEANPAVEQLGSQVAVQRGPVVYCLESPDLPDGVNLMDVSLPENIVWKTEPKLTGLGTMLRLTGIASVAAPMDWKGELYQPLDARPRRHLKVTLIPYYAWANRGVSDMSVWLPLTSR